MVDRNGKRGAWDKESHNSYRKVIKRVESEEEVEEEKLR